MTLKPRSVIVPLNAS